MFASRGNTITEAQYSAAIALRRVPIPFILIVNAPLALTPGSNFSDTVPLSSDSSTTDPNNANNTATVTGSIVVHHADLAVINVSGVTTVDEEGDTIVYSVTVTNNGPNSGIGVVLTDTLGSNLSTSPRRPVRERSPSRSE